jgi:hypothetical protein
MITTRQAMKACILAQFLTNKGLQISVFQYFPRRKLIVIETLGERKIRTLINEDGRFKYVD